MKKVIFLAGLFMASHHIAGAQTYAEWFRQRSTQKKYLLQQIAALKMYIDYAAKGYEIAGKGIATVRNIKKGDLDLHRDFFEALKAVNPVIDKYARVGDIILLQIRIIQTVKKTLENVQASGQFTSQELAYCKGVLNGLMDDCTKSVESLVRVTTSGELSLRDDERLKQINTLYEDMQSSFAFCAAFSSDMKLLALQRTAGQTEIKGSKIINGIK